MRFEFLEAHRGEIGPIKKACGLMKVSRSGFYEYLSRKKSNAQIERGRSRGSSPRPSGGTRAATATGASTANCERAASP